MRNNDIASLEIQAAELLKKFLHENKDLLQHIKSWGDGECGYFADTAKKILGVADIELPAASAAYRKKKIGIQLRKRVFERDEYRCKHCGTHLDLTLDHIIPESKGGESKFDNLQTLCNSCNLKKGTQMPQGGRI